jgi:hypothetical protein
LEINQRIKKPRIKTKKKKKKEKILSLDPERGIERKLEISKSINPLPKDPSKEEYPLPPQKQNVRAWETEAEPP